MKKFIFVFFLLCTSCEGTDFSCSSPSEYNKNTAQSYYDTFGTSLVSDAEHNKIRKKFACQYRAGDKIYAYTTFWSTYYVLVRYGEAVMYVEGKHS